MSKFLALCEEFDPALSQDPIWDLIDFFESKGIKASKIRGTNNLYIDTGSKNIPITVIAEEDAEGLNAGYGEFNVNNEVENLATKAEQGLKGTAQKLFGNSAQQAAGAIKARQRVSQDAVKVYKNQTNKLKQDLAKASKI